MSQIVSYNLKDGVSTITLDDGKVNALGSSMFEQLNAAFDKAEQDEAIIVLTGRKGIFSAGYDLKEMQKSQEASLELVSKGSKFARRILAHPRPVILASTGHTIAMGAFIALACDYRILKKGRFMTGLNETLIGMTMHNFGLGLAQYRLTKQYFNRCAINAEMFPPSGALKAGFFDRTVWPWQFDKAVSKAVKTFSLLDKEAFKGTKTRSRKALFEALDQAIADDLDPKKIHA